jgi:hypothetical protein
MRYFGTLVLQDRADVSKRAVKMHVQLFKAATVEGQPPLMQPLKTLTSCSVNLIVSRVDIAPVK